MPICPNDGVTMVLRGDHFYCPRCSRIERVPVDYKKKYLDLLALVSEFVCSISEDIDELRKLIDKELE